MTGVRVTGLRDAQRTLTRIGASADDLKDVMFSIGNKIVQDVKALTPVRTGTLRDSFRASKTRSKAVIRGGNKGRVKYASFVEFGSVHNTAENMTRRAITQNEQYALQTLEHEIESLIRRYT